MKGKFKYAQDNKTGRGILSKPSLEEIIKISQVGIRECQAVI